MAIIISETRTKFLTGSHFFQKAILALIRFYKCAVSPHFPPSCRYYPSCSTYAFQAVTEYGVMRGLYMAAKRILRCHPFSRGGYDPVKNSEGCHHE